MNIQKVTIIGGGVLGSQIAYQSAFCGFDVTIYMRSESSITRTQPKLDRLHGIYIAELTAAKAIAGTPGAAASRGLVPDLANTSPAEIDVLLANADKAAAGIHLETDLVKAVADADLIIEAMAEDPKQKIEMYQRLAPIMAEKTILATNSSTLLPSTFAQYTGRPAKYLAMHFANNIWRGNTAEIMGHADTDSAVYDEIVEFAKAINMIPLCLHKEQPGYILNSLLVPFLNAAEHLWAGGVADPQTIDLTWKLATGAPRGPFAIIDVVGLTTVYNIGMMHPGANDPSTAQGKLMQMLKEKIDAGETGINAGVGFYDYRNQQ